MKSEKYRVLCLGAKNPETVRILRAIENNNPNFSCAGFLDNDQTKSRTDFYGYPVLGGSRDISGYVRQNIRFCTIITGSTEARFEATRELVKQGAVLCNLIHPDVNLEMVNFGTGNYIQEHAIIQAGVKIGNNSSIHTAAVVSHETSVGHSVFIAHGANISGEVTVEDGVFIGAGATILPRLRIGRWSIIGAGATVIRDVPEYSVVVGNPGRFIRKHEIPYPDGNVFLDQERK